MFDPQKYVSKHLYGQTLRNINIWRKKYGMKPINKIPEGERKQPNSCPIAMSFRDIDAWVEVCNYTMVLKGRTITMSPTFINFVDIFDTETAKGFKA